MKITKIRTRMLLFLIPLVLCIALLLTGISYYFSRVSLTDAADNNAQAVGEDYANRIKDKIDLNFSQLEALAATPLFRSESPDRNLILAELAAAKKRSDQFEGIFYIRLDGSGYSDVGKNTSIAKRDFYKNVVATNQKSLSNSIVSQTTGTLTVAFAVPILNDGKLVGLVTATVPMEKLSSIMDTMKFMDSGYGQLVDANGMLIGHPKDKDLVGKINLASTDNKEAGAAGQVVDKSMADKVKSILESGQSVIGSYISLDQQKYAGIFKPVDLSGGQRWGLIVSAPEKEVSAASYHLSLLLMTVSILFILIAIGVILFIARHFTKPIEALRDECQLLAEGDLRERNVVIDSEDELGQLGSGFRKMQKNLQTLVRNVHMQTEQLAASSEELTATAEQSAEATQQVVESMVGVAADTEDQRETTVQAHAAVQQVSSGLEDMAAKAQDVDQQSAETERMASMGDVAVKQAVDEMAKIKGSVGEVKSVVEKLGERSSAIGEIITTISNIAGQTNLLALNAAIEAARAGEHGRGFAVVAEEVRKLAEQSQVATSRISEMVNAIQLDTDVAVEAMRHSSTMVEDGSEAVDTAGTSFNEILQFVQKTSKQVKEISVAIDHIAKSSEGVVASVTKIDKVSKTTASRAESVSSVAQEQSAATESIAAASRNLAELAAQLQTAVSAFQV